MAIIRMVRHGQAAAGFGEHADPGLSNRGREQAARVAGALGDLGPLAIVSSPMARAVETAEPLAARWGCDVVIEHRVSEIPSPGLTPEERGPWLRTLMDGTWDDAPEAVRAWRTTIAEVLLSLTADTVVFSHFVATNAAIGIALGSSTPRARQVDYCSVTAFDTTSGSLVLLEGGAEAETTVL